MQPLSRETLVFDLQEGGEIDPPEVYKEAQNDGKGVTWAKSAHLGPQNVGKTITKGARRTARSD